MKKTLWIAIFLLTIVGALFCQSGDVELVIVVDNSGSMALNDPDKLSSRILKYLPTLLDNVQLTVTIFRYDSSPTNLGSITGDTSTEAFNDMIDHVNYAGLYTDYARAFAESMQYLSRSDAAVKSIILMTDGELNIDENEAFYAGYATYDQKIARAEQMIDEVTVQANRMGIPVHSLILSTEIAGDDLKEVSEATGGSFNYVNTKNELDQSFNELIGVLLGIADNIAPQTFSETTPVVVEQEKIDQVFEEFKKEYVVEEPTSSTIEITNEVSIIDTVPWVPDDELTTNEREIYERIYAEQLDVIYSEVYEEVYAQFVEESNLIASSEDCTDLEAKYKALLSDYNGILYDYKQLNKRFEKYTNNILIRREELNDELETFADGLSDTETDTADWLEAFEDDPGSVEAKFYMADYLIDNGNYKAAYRILSGLIADGLPEDIPPFVYGVLAKGYYFSAKFDKLKTLNSDYGDSHYLVPYYTGVMYLKLGEYAEAFTDLTESVALKSDFYGSQYNLGMIYYYREDFGNAVYRFNQAKAIKDTAKVRYMLGNCYYRQEKYALAATNYLKTVEYDPEYYEAYYNLAVLSMSDGNYLSAHGYLYDAIRYRNDIPELYLLDGFIYYYSGNYQTAYADFKKASELGDAVEADIGMVLALLSADYLDNAYEHITAMDQNDVMGNEILSDLYFALSLFYNDTDQLSGYLDEFTSRKQQSSYYLLGNYYLMRGDTDTALEYYEQSVELSRDSVMGTSVLMDITSANLQTTAQNRELILTMVAQLTNEPDLSADEVKTLYQYFLSERLYDESLQYLSKIMETDSDNSEFYLSLFQITFPEENIAGTVADLKTRSENAENMEYLLYFSAFRQAMSQTELAAEGYEDIIAQSDDEDMITLATKNLAVCRLELGDYQDALDIYHRLVTDGEGDAVIFYNMATCYLHLKKMTLAKRYYESAYSVDPKMEEALLNLIAVNLYYEDAEEVQLYLDIAGQSEIFNEDLLLFYTAQYYELTGDLVSSADYREQLETRYPDFVREFKPN